MRILVTGGTGFLGSRLIPTLVSRSHEVVAITRSGADAEHLAAKGAHPIIGDLANSGSIRLPEIDAVVHAAAYFRFAGPRAPYFKINVEGTNTLLRAAEQGGVKTFVHISAAGVIMDDGGTRIRNADERARTYPESFSGYVASKAQSEALVLAANKPGFRTIALRPPALWGPGDTFSKQLPQAIASGRFAFFHRGDYPFATCHVDNLIEAIQCALGHGEGGRPYFIQDKETNTFRDFIGLIATALGVSIDRVRSIPFRLAFLIGWIMEVVATLTGNKADPPLSRSLVRMIGREFTIDDQAARRDLGYVGKTSRSAGRQMYIEAAAAAGMADSQVAS
ncbi:NAD-dependent epimerase/dehydratase family protein [Flavisphingomonas formosensis]|uniref:NAD-dependent epimerase/dehydratase family protein n=1 Tax=Flavisphingomonas formosensis TaxID=861534 RepID=UPI0012F8548A|nr:NAD-dependent epimerase/dehydratase family protein [Sphingomonas formosensis]